MMMAGEVESHLLNLHWKLNYQQEIVLVENPLQWHHQARRVKIVVPQLNCLPIQYLLENNLLNRNLLLHHRHQKLQEGLQMVFLRHLV